MKLVGKEEDLLIFKDKEGNEDTDAKSPQFSSAALNHILYGNNLKYYKLEYAYVVN